MGGTPIAEVLCVGALTRDWRPGQATTPSLGAHHDSAGWVAGGAVLYAGLAIAAAGARPHVVTTCDQALGASTPARSWAGAWHISEQCARFENVETASGRRQRVWSPGASLPTSLGDEAWRGMSAGAASAVAERVTSWIMLAPVLDELDYPSWLAWASRREARVALVPQGWLRASPDGAWPAWLRAAPWSPVAGSRGGTAARGHDALVEVVSLSEEELQQQSGLFDQLRVAARTVVVTLGARGAWLSSAGRELSVPAAQVAALDTTGAGDAFAGGLVARLAQGASLEASAAFASAAAALTTERVGACALDAPRAQRMATSVRCRRGAMCDVKPHPPR